MCFQKKYLLDSLICFFCEILFQEPSWKKISSGGNFFNIHWPHPIGQTTPNQNNAGYNDEGTKNSWKPIQNPTKNSEKKNTQGLLFWVRHPLKPMKVYLLLKMMIFHCHVSFVEGKTYENQKKKVFILEVEGFPFWSPTCQKKQMEKIPTVTEPLNPTPTNPRNFQKPLGTSRPSHFCLFPCYLFHSNLWCFLGFLVHPETVDMVDIPVFRGLYIYINWWRISEPSTFSNMSNEKTLLTFHYTGWLIGILIMAYYNPYITG